MNLTIVHGRLGRDPEMKFTSSGMAVCEFSIAIDEYAGKDKEKRTEWVNIKAWNKLAETCNQYLVKGKECIIQGRIHTDSWEVDGGGKRYKTYVIADKVQFVGSKSSGQNNGPSEVDDSQVEDISFTTEENG
jgi:single-strand DNA-binding protein